MQALVANPQGTPSLDEATMTMTDDSTAASAGQQEQLRFHQVVNDPPQGLCSQLELENHTKCV